MTLFYRSVHLWNLIREAFSCSRWQLTQSSRLDNMWQIRDCCVTFVLRWQITITKATYKAEYLLEDLLAFSEDESMTIMTEILGARRQAWCCNSWWELTSNSQAQGRGGGRREGGREGERAVQVQWSTPVLSFSCRGDRGRKTPGTGSESLCA